MGRGLPPSPGITFSFLSFVAPTSESSPFNPSKMSGQLQYYQAQFEKFIEQPGVVNDALTYVQNKTQVKKAYIAYGVIAVVTLWLMFGFGAQLLCNFIGFLYPAYKSIKALESSTKADDTQWLMKCAFLLWCMSPLEGSSVIYHRIIRPYFLKHESAIDDAVRKGAAHVSKITDAAVEKAKDYAAEQQLNKSE